MHGPNKARYQGGVRTGKLASDPKGVDMTEAERRTVAIVDDDYAVRESLRFLLEVIGYTVEIFASAAEFLKANVRHSPA